MSLNQVRLRKGDEVRRVLQQGRWVNTPLFTMKYVERREDEPVRFTVIVSRKVFKKAVDRNRAKRLVREAFRPWLERLKNVDVVFLVRQEIAGKKMQEVREVMESMLSMQRSKIKIQNDREQI